MAGVQIRLSSDARESRPHRRRSRLSNRHEMACGAPLACQSFAARYVGSQCGLAVDREKSDGDKVNSGAAHFLPFVTPFDEVEMAAQVVSIVSFESESA